MLMFTNVFKWLWDSINGLVSKIGIDDLIKNIMDYYYALDDVFKLLIFLLTAVILILGIISFIKKIFKLFIVIAVIFVIYFVVKSM